MNHSWGKKKEVNELNGLKHDRCITCGCSRYKISIRDYGRWISQYRYERSDINFNNTPVCIDWTEKDGKTID